MVKLEGSLLTVAINVALVLAQVSFGAFHVVGKDALNYINAIVFAFYREISAGPSLVAIAWIVERKKPDIPRDWWRFLILGTMLYLNQLLFIEGLNLTSATQAAIMQPCIPVFTTAMALILKMEKFNVLKIIGILFSAGGAVVMVGVENLSLENSQTQGMLCLVGNTFAVSVFYILQKPVLLRYPPISVTGWSYIVASAEMGLTSLVQTHGVPSAYYVAKEVIFPLVFATVFATIFAYMAITWANKYAPASVVAAYNSLQPLAAATFSYIFESLVPTSHEYIGGSAIIVGLGVVTFARVRETREEEAKKRMETYQPINTPDTPHADFQRKSFEASDTTPLVTNSNSGSFKHV